MLKWVYMKKYTALFWVSTSLIFIFEGVMPALTFNSEMAVQGIISLGYPLYFVTLLTVFKILGSVALIVPQIPARVKEWAYAGFAFDFIFAFVSLWVVYGLTSMTFFPILALAVLVLSYISYQKIKK